MKKIQIKLWPESVHYLPAIIPLQNPQKKENDLYIDFSNCSQVNSSGLTFLVVRLLSMISQGKPTRNWECDNLYENPIFEKIISGDELDIPIV